MKTFEQVLKIKLPNVVLADAEKFIRESDTYFASIHVYLGNRQKVSTADWGLKSIIVCQINGQIDFNDPVEFIESKSGIFPNAEGLAIAGPLVRGNYPMRTVMYGFDKKENLWEPAGIEEPLFVPYIAMQQENFYFGLSSFGKTSHIAKTNNSYITYIAD